MMDLIRYPIGQFEYEEEISLQTRNGWIDELTKLTERVKQAIDGLTEEELNHRYREGGWSLRQVVHHIADSTMHSYIRFKWALTEVNPLIKPYDEADWGELPDAREGSVYLSLQLLEGLVARFVTLLRSMDDADFARTFRHPELEEPQRLDYFLGFSVWHGKHHVAQITSFRERENV